MKKWFWLSLPILLTLLVWFLIRQTAQTVSAEPLHVTLLPATVPVTETIQTRVAQLLENEAPRLGVFKFAITDVGYKEKYWTVSVAGLALTTEGKWHLEDALWLGTVMIADTPGLPGIVTDVSPSADAAAAATAPENGRGGSQNILPWRSGTTAIYGTLGVHDCGFSLTGWKAVDLFPTENQVFATQGGEVSYVCRDSTQVAVRIGDNLYDHLVDTGQKIGDQYAQGGPLGSLVPGTFDDTCGYASQQPTSAHVHFCFIPNPTSGSWAADGYALSIYNNNWVKGDETVEPMGTLTADWANAGVVPPGPAIGANMWDSWTGGMVSMADHFLPVLPSHTAMGLAERVVSIAAIPLKILYITVLSNFDMTVAIWCFGIFIGLESVRLILAGILLLKNLKQLIPIIG